MRSLAIVLAASVLTVALPSTAQSPAPLPAALSGRWTVVPPGGRTLIDAWSVRFDGSGAPGPVKGRVTWRGRGCGAQDEPVEGTWDGTELKFQFIARPNVNTHIQDATYCAEGRTTVALRRKGGPGFEGEASLNGGPANIMLTASP